MPQTYSYPGVYVEEISSGVRTIAGVSTSDTAFVDFFARGPVNRPQRITSFGEFTRLFGGLDRRSAASYAIQQYFLNGGAVAWVVRTMAETVETASLTLTNGADDILRVDAIRPGTWANRHLRISSSPGADAGTFNLQIEEVDGEGGATVVTNTEDHLNLSMDVNAARYAPTIVNAASAFVQLARLSLTNNAIPDPITIADDRRVEGGVDGTIRTASLTLTDGTVNILRVDANSPGTWANRHLRISLPEGADDGAFNLSIEEVTGEGDNTAVVSTEDHFNLSMNANAARYAPTIVNAASQLVQLARLSLPTNNAIPTTVSPTDGLVVGGADGDEPGNADNAWRTTTGAPALINAMQTLDEIVPFVFNLLCIPAAVDLDEDDMNAVYTEAISYVETKRAFLILDIPSTINTEAQMRTSWPPAGANFASRNAAVYFPRLMVADALQGNTPQNMAASGTIAGVCARIDAQRGVWRAPGGTDAVMRGASVTTKINDLQNGALNITGKNALRTFPIYGDVVWGARTMRGADQMADEYKYVPVRRTALYIEESLYQGLKWVVFEPNDEPLWAQIRLNVGAFMNSLFRQGAFQGTSAREAYFVKCDRETTLQNDIDRGIVNIVVGFAPLKPVEYVVLQIQQIAGQLQV